jgi:hypothetical protein
LHGAKHVDLTKSTKPLLLEPTVISEKKNVDGRAEKIEVEDLEELKLELGYQCEVERKVTEGIGDGNEGL